MAEGVRFAAAELLDVDAREIRSTFRFHGGGMSNIEIVVYDSAAGGTGYSNRLGNNTGRLLELLKKRLTCECSSGCRRCLADYSNQKWWDYFDRIAVLEWLENLDVSISTFDGFPVWMNSSSLALKDIFAAHNEIWIVGSHLISSAISKDVTNLIIQWLASQKSVKIIITQDLNQWLTHEKPSSDAITTLKKFIPWVNQGALQIVRLPLNALANGGLTIPRIFAGGGIGAPVILIEQPLTAIMNNLIPSLPYKGEMNQEQYDITQKIIAAVQAYPNTVLDRLFNNIKIFDFAPGATRNFREIFQNVLDQEIKLLFISDPYCGAGEKNREILQNFVRKFQNEIRVPKEIKIVCREQKEESHFSVLRLIEIRLTQLGISDPKVIVERIAASKFHDREILINTEYGEQYRFVLTGGIDYLLNINSDTKVIVQKINQ